MHDDNDESKALSRRSFLGWIVAAAGAFVTATVGLPIVGLVISPALAEKAKSWVQVGPLADFPIGVPTFAEFTIFRKDGWVEEPARKSLWVLRKSEQEVTVFNGRCTHLGCAYSWKTEGEHASHFFCPCHDGVYDISGKVIGGPPPRPLDDLETRFEDSTLAVRYADFRIGIPEKIEI